MLQAGYQASGSADFCLVWANCCVCLLKVRQIATVEPLEVLVVMLVGSTWQQGLVHRTKCEGGIL